MHRYLTPCAALALLGAASQARAEPVEVNTFTGAIQVQAFVPVGQTFIAEDEWVRVGFHIEDFNAGNYPAAVEDRGREAGRAP